MAAPENDLRRFERVCDLLPGLPAASRLRAWVTPWKSVPCDTPGADGSCEAGVMLARVNEPSGRALRVATVCSSAMFCSTHINELSVVKSGDEYCWAHGPEVMGLMLELYTEGQMMRSGSELIDMNQRGL